MNGLNAPTWITAALPVFFIGMWVLVLHALSRMGGWRDLAESYGTAVSVDGQTFDGQTFRFRSGRLGTVNYNSCLTLTAGAAGLRLAVLLPFRAGHHPFVVPWAEITAKEYRGWVFNYVDLQFSRKPKVRLTLSRGLAKALAAASGGALRIT